MNGTQTLAMWIMITSGPTGSEPRGWREVVVAPAGLGDGLEAGAGRLLEEQRHAVGEADDAGGVVGGQFAAEGDGRLDLERPAAIDIRLAGAGGVELGLHALEHAGEQLPHADGRQAVGRRAREAWLPGTP